MVCTICFECGHNKTTCHKYRLPFFNDIKKKKDNKEIMDEVDKEDIDLFYINSTRGTSDEFNKKREQIICNLGNGIISAIWIQNDSRWAQLHTELYEVINNLKPINITYHKLNIKGGRSKNYDFELIFYESGQIIKLFKLEFKYGANEICECPQFVSPMKPSQYLTGDYEEYFYDSYVPQICELAQVPVVDKSGIKKVFNTKTGALSSLS